MGKNAQRRRRRTASPRLAHLIRAAELVGRYFDTEAHCIEAAALLTKTADLLGYQLQPRAVALAAQREGHPAVVLGEQAAKAWNGLDITADFADRGWDGAGHVVATLDDPPYLFDPTLQQIAGRLGITPFSLTTPVPTVYPDDGVWNFYDDGLGLRYYLVPEDTTWRDHFDASLDACAAVAGDIATIVRSGQRGLLVKE